MTVFLVSHTLIQYGSVPLGIAARYGHTKTVQRLLEAEANTNHQNKVMTVNVVNSERIHISENLWTPLCKKGSTVFLAIPSCKEPFRYL